MRVHDHDAQIFPVFQNLLNQKRDRGSFARTRRPDDREVTAHEFVDPDRRRNAFVLGQSADFNAFVSAERKDRRKVARAYAVRNGAERWIRRDAATKLRLAVGVVDDLSGKLY